jgi:uncharacterized membrane protein YfcA
MDWAISVTGLLAGVVVGLTGMGGGALLTPILVLVLGVPPVVAVSSDLTASLFMKPVGAAVHWSRGTVDRSLVKYLVLGSVPAALLGAAMFSWFENDIDRWLRPLLGGALLVAAGSMAFKAALTARRGEALPAVAAVRPLRTALVGAFGGLVVGLTSVGSGSLILVLLMLLHPGLKASRLVGTDLAQAIPLVGAAAVGHMLFCHVDFGLAGALMLGALPGVYVGARLSSRASDRIIRPVLFVVLIASALKLLGAATAHVVFASLTLALVFGVRLAIGSTRRAAEQA